MVRACGKENLGMRWRKEELRVVRSREKLRRGARKKLLGRGKE